jgi:hypothetical protein
MVKKERKKERRQEGRKEVRKGVKRGVAAMEAEELQESRGMEKERKNFSKKEGNLEDGSRLQQEGGN